MPPKIPAIAREPSAEMPKGCVTRWPEAPLNRPVAVAVAATALYEKTLVNLLVATPSPVDRSGVEAISQNGLEFSTTAERAGVTSRELQPCDGWAPVGRWAGRR